MEEITVIPYSKEYAQDVRDIAYETAFLGESASIYFDDREILEDFLTNYFLEYEPESCFIAHSNNKIAGYLIGAKDSSWAEKVSSRKIIPFLSFRLVFRGTLFRKKCFSFIARCIKSFFAGEFFSPVNLEEYPATFHVNMKKEYRSCGIGARLVDAYMAYLRGKNIKGVHLATLSGRAAEFYEKLGFVLLDKRKRSYFRHLLHKDIFCYIYGKKITG